jgi:hypothetical protein
VWFGDVYEKPFRVLLSYLNTELVPISTKSDSVISNETTILEISMIFGPAAFGGPLAEKHCITVWILKGSFDISTELSQSLYIFRYRKIKQNGNEAEVILIVWVQKINFF